MFSGKLISFLKAITIGLPFFIGLLRFGRMDKSFQPFLIYLFIGLITEIATYVHIATSANTNAVISNVFVLVEWLLITWQFQAWGIFRNHPVSFALLIGVIAATWFVENFWFGNIVTFSPYYREVYSFVVVLMSVSVINYTIIHDYKNVLKNARFLLCLGLIVFFLYKMIYEWAYQIINVKRYEELSNQIISWFDYVNAGVNMVFALAMLFAPARTRHRLINLKEPNSR
ncbi:hypothetical protein EXU57_02320 [Segetibacter sp. 3557_3]|uniref:hypothetical protein n=1 Tax=Segetibacter sp. 3557_3 TaxID=2547429 RepID=UPI0010589A82|nr:hypothetical protein [Segetibacter sp. 3557_3]TDH28929.1 hypothetical protein EXU57_02320 [Segetibacter sp. 3557_3]